MKKLAVFMMLLVLSFTSRAQVAQEVVFKPVKPGEEPKAVLDSIKKEFPDPVIRTFSLLPGKTYGEQWNVHRSRIEVVNNPDYYEVDIKTPKGYQTQVYDKDGNLLRVKQVIKDVDLPEVVQNAIATEFPGWTILEEQERISSAEKYTLEYKVKLKKGLLRKTVFVDPAGNIEKELPI